MTAKLRLPTVPANSGHSPASPRLMMGLPIAWWRGGSRQWVTYKVDVLAPGGCETCAGCLCNHSLRRFAMNPADLQYLKRAIVLSGKARNAGKHPFAATVIAADGSVLAEAGNNSLPPDGDPTQHAELLAAQIAARAAPPEVLAAATLYSSAEPCAMCAGAIYWCGIGRVVYALSEERLLHLTGDHPDNPTFSLPCREVFGRGQRKVAVVGPALEEEAAVAHLGFWQRDGAA